MLNDVSLTNLTLIVTTTLTFLTLVFNARQARLREERHRAWELEDRKALAGRVSTTTNEIKEAIAENTMKTEQATAAAHEAYQEANHVNVKISDLNARLLHQEQERSRGADGAPGPQEA